MNATLATFCSAFEMLRLVVSLHCVCGTNALSLCFLSFSACSRTLDYCRLICVCIQCGIRSEIKLLPLERGSHSILKLCCRISFESATSYSLTTIVEIKSEYNRLSLLNLIQCALCNVLNSIRWCYLLLALACSIYSMLYVYYDEK